MLEYFKTAKADIAAVVNKYMEEYGQVYHTVSAELGLDAARRLAEFTGRGKMIRGCLVRLGYELASGRSASGPDLEAVTMAGAAMELFQSGLLVHDDIMDRDRLRRGAPTLHVTYENSLLEAGALEPPHHGVALGICAGDLAYFAAFQLLAEMPVQDPAARQACLIAARELALVGVAQMQDVTNGAKRPDTGGANISATKSAQWIGPAEAISEDDVLRLYRYKTGRYTFSLPLALGAAIAGAAEPIRAALEAAGEHFGILFQLKDDELGLFADEADLGKPIGADVKEDKKTLFRLRLFRQAGAPDLDRLRTLFGGGSPSPEQLLYIRGLVEKLGIRSELTAMMREQANLAEQRIAGLLQAAPSAAAAAWRELAAYSLERNS
ncbi:MAG: polyprenyl synthetase family protein [Spirochaetes bacterium]|nr:polyprenyl synthetase family protein [Spirochaetota bacterium]